MVGLPLGFRTCSLVGCLRARSRAFPVFRPDVGEQLPHAGGHGLVAHVKLPPSHVRFGGDLLQDLVP